MGLVWIDYLEVVISGHTEPTTGIAWPSESSDPWDISNQRNSSDQVLSCLRSSSGVGNPISPSLTSLFVRNPSEFFLYLNCGHDMKPIEWWSYRVRVKSSLVLLEIFSHPVQLWCSPIPIRIVNWRNPSSGLGNLKCQFYLDIRDASKWGLVKINLVGLGGGPILNILEYSS